MSTVDIRSLLATLAETYVEVLDELVQLLDQALAGANSRARHELNQRLIERARVEIDRGRLLDEVLDILADPACVRCRCRPTGPSPDRHAPVAGRSPPDRRAGTA